MPLCTFQYVMHFRRILSPTGILPTFILSTVAFGGYSHPPECSPVPNPFVEIPQLYSLKSYGSNMVSL